ncbi:Rieske (2Fe-2S) protein [Simplicispira hankyongi]|jgi:nitrite reductase/ring-hydroxylating ferredoxin subunit|uniref:Rieske (2Fe-2S) protein n=1 Tax=Simplicispira hankyongi TaxID=2315688 RepID=A0A398C5F4_9BURK|nr:Rieske 2Fe-2S domain-containing protein [Simplicispira hankyongi]RID98249.1 Rieske (2Fe-2S) protein [Simplicispira hankyongi]
MSEAVVLDLCASGALADSGAAVPFDVVYQGQPCRAFAIRFQGQAHAYLNRCGHVPMEMDYVDGQFFDSSGQWLMCATHGATYAPQTGLCVAGPCRQGLIKIAVSEEGGRVRWHTSPQLQPSRR